MKLSLKKILLSACALLFALCMVFATLSFTSVEANTVQQKDKADFCVIDGASVRTVANSSGIRFQTQISKTFYDSVKDSNPEWGSIYAYEQSDASTLTLESVNPSAGINKFNPGVAITPVAETDEGGNVLYYYYNTVLTFDHIDNPDDFAMFCKMYINVRSFVTVGDTTYYSCVDANSNTYHSMSKTAERALVRDKSLFDLYGNNPKAAEIIKNYILQDAFRFPVIRQETAYSYDMYKNQAKQITDINVPNGEYTLTISDEAKAYVIDYPVTVASNTIDLDSSFKFTDMTLGNTYILSLKNDAYNYVQQFKYVSKVLTTVAEYLEMVQFYHWQYATGTSNLATYYYDGASFTQRYYVLGNNITGVTGSKTANGHVYNYDAAFRDILDGQGFSVTYDGLTLRGMFGGRQSGANAGIDGTIKNISLISPATALANSNTEQNTILGTKFSGVLENVYIDVNATSTDTGKNNVLFQIITGTLNNVYVNFADTMGAQTSGVAAQSYGYISYTMGTTSNVHVITANMTVAAHQANKTTYYYAQNETSVTLDGTANIGKTGLFRYNEAASLASNTDITSEGVTKVGNWVIDTNSESPTYGTATWSKTATTFAPDLNKEVKPVIVKSEYVVNSKEVDDPNSSARSALEITLTDLPANIDFTKVLVDGEAVDDATVDLVNSKVLLRDKGLSADKLGEIVTLTLKDQTETNTYVQGFRYIHKEITSADDFNNFLQFYQRTSNTDSAAKLKGTGAKFYNGSTFTQRYYVLANDITVTTSATQAIYDILDGQGYKVTTTNVEYRGIFGDINAGAVIKNLAMEINGTIYSGSKSTVDDVNGQFNQATTFAMYVRGGAAIENLYLDINAGTGKILTTENIMPSQGVVSYLQGTAKDVYVNISDSFKKTAQTGTGINYGLIGVGTEDDAEIKNFHVVSASDMKEISYKVGTIVYAKNESNLGDVFQNADIYRYDNASAMSINKVGSWVINSDGTAYYDNSNEIATHLYVDQTIDLGTGELAVATSDSSVVEVSGNKLVAKGAGKALVTVKENGVTTTYYITVEQINADITQKTFTVGTDTETSITLTIDGETVYSWVKDVTNDNIVVANNKITAVAAGLTTISVVFQIDGVAYVRDFNITVA